MIYESNIISLLNEVLNQNARIRKGTEAVFFCPFCTHYKKKLEISLESGAWHCWVCSARGKNFVSLLKKLKANKSQFDRLYSITKQSPQMRRKKDEVSESVLSLPPEFHPLYNPLDSVEYQRALFYVKKRGVTPDDILRYNIGYCEGGEYRQRIIIPSYDSSGILNFFIARAYYDSIPFSHKGPPVSKNIIGFECFINWQYDGGISLCEGAFDAISIRKNAVPLFGKVMSDKLKETIVEQRVKRINMVLDNDAIKKALQNTKDLKKLGVSVHLVELEGKDPSKLGFEKVNKLIEESHPISLTDMIMYRLRE